MIRRAILLTGIVIGGLAAACGEAEDDSEAAEGAASTGNAIFGEADSLFQDDRVGRMLKDKLGQIPGDYVAYEQLFQVGRECKRADGKKEIFIVEEAGTRPTKDDGPQANGVASKIMPRAVITGCNTGSSSDTTTIKNSYSLMAALVSGEDGAAASRGDTMFMDPLETMAFDDKTGLYNFYVFDPAGDGKPGSVKRFWKDKDGKVMFRELASGSTTPTAPARAQNDMCFRCHMNGAPLMNEISEPWTNWISPKKKLPTVAMSGITKSLVEQATLADQLETIIRQGTDAYVNGLAASKGWLNRTRDGLLPGGTSKVIEPLFCQTELNYLSADTTLGIPLQTFFDPAVTAAAGLSLPDAASGKPTPFLLPIRGVHNETTERSLIKRGYLTDGMAVAIHLIDDENEIFSSKRCGVFTDVSKEIKAAEAGGSKMEPAAVKDVLKKVLTAKTASFGLQPARLTYFQARLDGTVHQAKQQAYNAELQTRFAAMDQSVTKREATKKAAAKKMFSAPANPLPILESR